MKRKIKAIVCDWGGVIGLPYHDDACKALAQYSSLTPEEVYEAVFASGIEKDFDEGRIEPKEFYARVCQAIQVSEKDMSIDQCKEVWQKVIVGDHMNISLVLTYIHPDIKLFLLSNTNVWHWEIMSRLERVEQYFGQKEQQILSFEFHHRKPDELMYREAIRRAGCEPEEMVYVDDILEFAKVFGQLGGYYIQYDCKKQLFPELGHAIWKIDPECLIGKHGYDRESERDLSPVEIEIMTRETAEYHRKARFGK